jgi:hypothetical protein
VTFLLTGFLVISNAVRYISHSLKELQILPGLVCIYSRVLSIYLLNLAVYLHKTILRSLLEITSFQPNVWSLGNYFFEEDNN